VCVWYDGQASLEARGGGVLLSSGAPRSYVHVSCARAGLTQLRFKPAYNPYTEPSMEIFAFHPGLKKWIEIGNSGMFRPEMLLPMGLDPNIKVLAWGLSLERYAYLSLLLTCVTSTTFLSLSLLLYVHRQRVPLLFVVDARTPLPSVQANDDSLRGEEHQRPRWAQVLARLYAHQSHL